jgi:hypothetical protein
MGACAIYTAIPDAALVPDVLAIPDQLPREEDGFVHARGWQRFLVGRQEVMELANAVMPQSHRDQARVLAARQLYGAFSPLGAHDPRFVDEIEQTFRLELSRPLWPSSFALAAIIGAAPATFIGWHRKSTHGVALLDHPTLHSALTQLEASPFPLTAWLCEARNRDDVVMLHWEQR